MTGWTAVIPIKQWSAAKSRLHPSPDARAALARAFALDVLDALHGAPSVEHLVIVTTVADLDIEIKHLGATVLADRQILGRGSLNGAIRLGRRWATKNAPSRGLVVLPADLPSLSSHHLEEALAIVGEHQRAFVPDASGSGTTLLAARHPRLLQPRYGADSALAHQAGGSLRIEDLPPQARLDVDDPDDLREAQLLGVGEHTRRVSMELSLS